MRASSFKAWIAGLVQGAMRLAGREKKTGSPAPRVSRRVLWTPKASPMVGRPSPNRKRHKHKKRPPKTFGVTKRRRRK